MRIKSFSRSQSAALLWVSSRTLTKMAAPSSACAAGPLRRTSLASSTGSGDLTAPCGRDARTGDQRGPTQRHGVIFPSNPLVLIPVRAEFTHLLSGWWWCFHADASSEKQPQLHHILWDKCEAASDPAEPESDTLPKTSQKSATTIVRWT